MFIRWLKITQHVHDSDETKFHIAVIGNLFATQPIGREITVYLARHLLKGLKIEDPTIVSILSNAVIHIVPVIDNAFEQIWGEFNRESHITSKPEKYVCNNITADFKEVGSQILDLNNRLSSTKDTVTRTNAFKHMLLDQKFDLILNIEGGNNGILYPYTHDKLEKYSKLANLYNSALKNHESCPKRISGTDSVLTDFLFKEYFTPMITLKVSCCDYPAVESLPYIWENILNPIMSVLNTTRTGVAGVVLNRKQNPLYNATIKVIGTEESYEVTKNKAHFKIMLPAGNYQIQISCHGYEADTMQVVVNEAIVTQLKVVLFESSGASQPSVHEFAETDEKFVITDTSMHVPFQGKISSGIKGCHIAAILKIDNL
ncbi:hypothetical protein ABEB36_006968 [Hypothenemus hampei]|uniref:Peptidase M14 domain-containing protein n=1 Tax=Hypothenemus hampei TaxID=57062 RepID=A0ABD1ESD5_HYPHA